MKSIFDSSFKYISSFDTDVRKTFARIRREQLAKNAPPAKASGSDTRVKVLQLEVKRGA